MTPAPTPDPVPPTVSAESVRSGDPAEVVASHVAFVNELVGAGVPADGLDRDSLRSYYVDYYLDQVVNGGFSQLVYNSRWAPRLVDLLREGLAAVGAPRHGALVGRGDALVRALGPARLAAFLASGYFGDNPERDALAAADEDFAAAVAEEDLTARNAAWLLGRPRLRVTPRAAFAAEAGRHRTSAGGGACSS